MSKRKQENKLWDKAKYSLERHHGYICSNLHSQREKLKKGFINIGLGGIIADVIGIKDIGNQYEPQIEVIAVEVKEKLPNYRERHMDQVKRASTFAHKVYLAAPRKFEPEEVELAIEEKIGLFELDPVRKKLKLIVPSPSFKPSDSKVVELMQRLGFVKCSVCNCYWNKNLISITSYRPTHVFSQTHKQKFVKFICTTCAKNLYRLHLKDLRRKFVEEWKYRPLNKKLGKFSLKMKKFAEKKDSLRIKEKLSKQDNELKMAKRSIRSLYKKTKKLDKRFRKTRKSLKSI
jgi:hypothetical protein